MSKMKVSSNPQVLLIAVKMVMQKDTSRLSLVVERETLKFDSWPKVLQIECNGLCLENRLLFLLST